MRLCVPFKGPKAGHPPKQRREAGNSTNHHTSITPPAAGTPPPAQHNPATQNAHHSNTPYMVVISTTASGLIAQNFNHPSKATRTPCNTQLHSRHGCSSEAQCSSRIRQAPSTCRLPARLLLNTALYLQQQSACYLNPKCHRRPQRKKQPFLPKHNIHAGTTPQCQRECVSPCR